MRKRYGQECYLGQRTSLVSCFLLTFYLFIRLSLHLLKCGRVSFPYFPWHEYRSCYLSICVSVYIYIYLQIYLSMHVSTHVRAWQCICAYDKYTTKVYSIQQNFRANTYRAHRAPRKFFFYCTNIVPRLQELLRLFVKGLVDVKAAYSYDFFSNCIVLNYTSFCFRCQSFRSFSIFSL